jgi:hypothetical protein
LVVRGRPCSFLSIRHVYSNGQMRFVFVMAISEQLLPNMLGLKSMPLGTDAISSNESADARRLERRTKVPTEAAYLNCRHGMEWFT